MKPSYIIYFLLSIVCSLNAMAGGGFQLPGTDPTPSPVQPTIKAPDPSIWSWEDPSGFYDLINADGNRLLSPPWDADDHFGINITTAMPKSADGWRLVDKKFTCADFYGASSCEDPTDLTVNWPRFVIYNPYTGVMRFFVLIDSQGYYDADSMYLKYELSHEDGALTSLAFKSGELSVAKSNSQSSPEDNQGHEIMAAMSHNDWVIFDIPFTYPSKTFNECSGVPNCTKDLFYMYPDNLLLKIDIYPIFVWIFITSQNTSQVLNLIK